MKRVQLDLPDQFSFSTTVSVRVSDVNYGGHLGNDDVLTLVHEARIRFLRQLGYQEIDVGGPGLIITNAEVKYVSEAQMGDQLTIDIATENITKRGFDQYYRLTNQDNDRVAVVRLGLLGYDYDVEKVVRLPEEFLNRLTSTYESND